MKAGPLILIAIGLSLGFRAGIWNIGAEGQYIIGAICRRRRRAGVLSLGRLVHLSADGRAGAFGGLLWAMIPAI